MRFLGPRRNRPKPISWCDYVVLVVGLDSREEIAHRTGLPPKVIDSWLRGDPPASGQAVSLFAAAYGRPAMEAHTHTGVLHEEETGVARFRL